MARSVSRLGLVFSGAYLSLYLFMAMLAIHTLMTRPATSEFSGVGMVLVTFPWSLLWVACMERLGLISWYEQFSGTPALYGLWASLACLPAALPNTAILYLVGRALDKARSHSMIRPRRNSS